MTEIIPTNEVLELNKVNEKNNVDNLDFSKCTECGFDNYSVDENISVCSHCQQDIGLFS
jgi:Zn ribbon nucleic-acid-binding protein